MQALFDGLNDVHTIIFIKNSEHEPIMQCHQNKLPVDGGDQLLPSDSEGLHGVLRVSVLEDERLLDLLVDALQLLQVRLELVHRLLVLAQPTQLLLQRTLQSC